MLETSLLPGSEIVSEPSVLIVIALPPAFPSESTTVFSTHADTTSSLDRVMVVPPDETYTVSSHPSPFVVASAETVLVDSMLGRVMTHQSAPGFQKNQ
jgi:hypothetical protein